VDFSDGAIYPTVSTNDQLSYTSVEMRFIRSLKTEGNSGNSEAKFRIHGDCGYSEDGTMCYAGGEWAVKCYARISENPLDDLGLQLESLVLQQNATYTKYIDNAILYILLLLLGNKRL
jgi:hypothetical protein